jgi:hypothetical protein
MEGLDPVLLLKHIREAQDTVMALVQNRTPETVATDVKAFVGSLRTAWQAGEVRPTHRQEPKPGHWWRTRPDPFAEVWPVLLGWLEERPDMEAKEMHSVVPLPTRQSAARFRNAAMRIKRHGHALMHLTTY